MGVGSQDGRGKVGMKVVSHGGSGKVRVKVVKFRW